MSNDSGKKRSDKKVLHLDEAERVPRAPAFAKPAMADEGRSHDLPAVPGSSQAAEVVKQIIEQILVNERRRARIEFVQISGFFLVFLFAILGTGIWFARQLLVQLRVERQITEQTWRMIAGHDDGVRSAYPPTKPVSPALNREEVAKLEQNINALSEFLKTNPQGASTSVRDMLQNQQDAIQALSARFNEAQVNMAGAEFGATAAPEGTRQVDSTAGGPRFAGALRSGESAPGGFIAVPLAEDLNLRMPIPSL